MVSSSQADADNLGSTMLERVDLSGISIGPVWRPTSPMPSSRVSTTARSIQVDSVLTGAKLDGKAAEDASGENFYDLQRRLSPRPFSGSCLSSAGVIDPTALLVTRRVSGSE